MTEGNGRNPTLYRFFDAGGDLLYVGISQTPWARFRQHAHSKPWWENVARVDMERFVDVVALRIAERLAIINEGPAYNVVHNRAPGTLRVRTKKNAAPREDKWSFYFREGNSVYLPERICPLHLEWEVNGDSMSDDFDPQEDSAAEVWEEWYSRYGSAGVCSIYWSVRSSDPRAGIAESAPFQFDDDLGDFLTYFTWPESVKSGLRLVWSRLPVADKRWESGRGDKGGFIQKLTGWKPSPLQKEVDVKHLAHIAGLVRA